MRASVKRGFGLVELMVSLGLATLFLMVGSDSLRTVFHAYRTNAERSAVETRMVVAHEKLVADLTNSARDQVWTLENVVALRSLESTDSAGKPVWSQGLTVYSLVDGALSRRHLSPAELQDLGVEMPPSSEDLTTLATQRGTLLVDGLTHFVVTDALRVELASGRFTVAQDVVPFN